MLNKYFIALWIMQLGKIFIIYNIPTFFNLGKIMSILLLVDFFFFDIK